MLRFMAVVVDGNSCLEGSGAYLRTKSAAGQAPALADYDRGKE